VSGFRMNEAHRELIGDVLNLGEDIIGNIPGWELVERTSFAEQSIESVVTLTKLGIDAVAFYDYDEKEIGKLTTAFSDVSLWIYKKVNA